MAKNTGIEGMDPTGTSITKKGANTLRISTVDVAGEYQAPEDLSSYSTNKNMGGKSDLLTCRNSSAHSKRGAVAAPTLAGGDRPTPMCSTCWNKIKNDSSKMERMPEILGSDPAQHAKIRTQIAQAETKGRARDAGAIHRATGQEIVVQGPGRRPTSDEKVDTAVETKGRLGLTKADKETSAWLEAAERSQKSHEAAGTTLRRAEIIGGRNPGPNHEEYMTKATAALKHSLKIGNGEIHMEAYHEEAGRQGLDTHTAGKYLPLAFAKHRRDLKSPITKPKKQRIGDIRGEGAPITDTFSETESIMGSEAPSASSTHRVRNIGAQE
jgi:hypothetical protein